MFGQTRENLYIVVLSHGKDRKSQSRGKSDRKTALRAGRKNARCTAFREKSDVRLTIWKATAALRNVKNGGFWL